MNDKFSRLLPQVLERLKYLLTSAAAPAALEPSLALLGDLALGGADVACAIADTPGLVSKSMEICIRLLQATKHFRIRLDYHHISHCL